MAKKPKKVVVEFSSLKQLDSVIGMLLEKVDAAEDDPHTQFRLLKLVVPLDKARSSRRKTVELGPDEGKTYQQEMYSRLMEWTPLTDIRKVLEDVDRLQGD